MTEFIALPFRPLQYFFAALTDRKLRAILFRPYMAGIIAFIVSSVVLLVTYEQYYAPQLSWWWEFLLIPGLLVGASILGFLVLLIGTELNFDSFFDEAFRVLGLSRSEKRPGSWQVTVVSITSLVFRTVTLAAVLVLNLVSLWTPGLNLFISFLAALFLAYDFYTAPCQAHGKGVRWQLRMMLGDPLFTLLFGYTMAVYFTLPLIGLLLAPTGYMIAIARLEHRITSGAISL